MYKLYKLYCRTYQTLLRLGAYFLPWREPELIIGKNSLDKLPRLIKSKDIESVLIVVSQSVISLGYVDRLFDGLDNEEIKYALYDKTVQNPTIDNIEEALEMYKVNNCQGIIAFGGGSPMDCAKGVGARIARPNKKIPEMKGLFKIRKRIPPLFAIPTTAGSGSEASIAMVVREKSTNEKYAIMDISLTSHYAILDPTLTISLPPHLTSTIGMDALTHAVEAYIGGSNTKNTKKLSKMAVKIIFENLYEAYSNGDNISARENMQRAAYYAGLAFTRAYVGNIHAIAHTLGGFYRIPHGLANAVIMPYVLEYYGKAVYKPLAELADLVGVAELEDSLEEKAQKFIQGIRALNKSMEIPTKINGIKEEDISTMVDRAYNEANPLYPVPKIFTKKDFLNIFNMIRK